MFRCLSAVRQLSKAIQPALRKDVISRNIWDLARPASDMRRLMMEMDRRMDEIEKDFFRWTPLRVSSPRFLSIEGVDQANERFEVNIDVTGYKPEEIKLSLKDGKLRIEAEMDRNDDGIMYKQSLVHEISVPENLDTSTLESQLRKDGILHIEGSIKIEDKDNTKIPIEGGEAEEDEEEEGTVKSKM